MRVCERESVCPAGGRLGDCDGQGRRGCGRSHGLPRGPKQRVHWYQDERCHTW